MTNFELKKLVRKNVATLKPYRCARQEAQEGILLDANESPYGAFNRYPDPYANEVKKELGFENVFVGNGSDEAIDLLLRAFCEPGRDEIVILEPTYGMYRVCAGINNVAVNSVLLDENFQIDLEKTLEAVNEDTKMIFACSPNNPTGNCMRDGDILGLCENFSGLVVVDEAYVEFADKRSLVEQIEKYPNLAILRTLSKAWAAAGIRLGYLIGSAEVVEILNRIKPPYNVNDLTQKAAVSILKGGVRKIDEIVLERERIACALKEMGLEVFPSDANFLLFRVNNARKVQEELKQQGVVVRYRGESANCENCLRVSVGTRDENDKFLESLKGLLKKVAFIDRDGVILFEPQDDFQVDSLDKYQILPGVVEALARLKNAGYDLVMVTNQDGVGTSSFPEESFLLVQNRLMTDLREEGVDFDEVFVCKHFAGDGCDCRKPKIGMVKNCLFNPAESLVIGDRESDRGFAQNLRVKGFKSDTNSGSLLKIVNQILL